jgi:hypothetical protein
MTTKLADVLPEVRLQPHQQRLTEEARASPLRKLLVHALGSGKTLTSIAAAEAHGRPLYSRNAGGVARSAVMSYSGLGGRQAPGGKAGPFY